MFRIAIKAAIAALLFSTVPLLCEGANPKPLQFYVSPSGKDTQDGSAKHPWASIRHAAASVPPASTVHVAPGTYYGPIVTKTSGVPGGRIRYISDKKWSAKIVNAGTEAVWTNTGDHIDIMGFDLTGNGHHGILTYGSNVSIVGNLVHDMPAKPCDNNGGAGIDHANYDAQNDDVIDNVVHDIGTPGCPRAHGIYITNRGGRIWNNTVYRNAGWGIHLWHAARDLQVSNNLAFQNGSGGIVVGAGDAPGGVTADNVVVSNNILIYNRIGIFEEGRTGPGNQYLNNLVFGNRAADIKLQTGREVGTLKTDPHLMGYKDDGTGDYRLSSVSPALRAGTPVGAPGHDANGVPRPENAKVDLGPYEFKSQKAPHWPWL